jgi:hypothetical protein
MYQFRLDSKSPYALRMPPPTRLSAVTRLAQDFVAYEQSLPKYQQTPYSSLIAELLNQIEPQTGSRISGESQRVMASETVKQLDYQAIKLVRHIWQTMNLTFIERPACAVEWGFIVRQSSGRILMPSNREERLAVLNAYIAKEFSRADHERFKAPNLENVVQVRDGLEANLSARQAGQTQRTISTATNRALIAQLLNHLHAAAVYLLAHRFDYTVNLELRNWGYTIVARNGHNGPGRENRNGHGSETNDLPAG